MVLVEAVGHAVDGLAVAHPRADGLLSGLLHHGFHEVAHVLERPFAQADVPQAVGRGLGAQRQAMGRLAGLLDGGLVERHDPARLLVALAAGGLELGLVGLLVLAEEGLEPLVVALVGGLKLLVARLTQAGEGGGGGVALLGGGVCPARQRVPPAHDLEGVAGVALEGVLAAGAPVGGVL
ncbi:hypothetical protein [Calidithermus chliarophilus]|uniref:hypothetical protein n=1 Tax=Calidithermus chliarophilus TaxID=52023 RepID=UPI0012F64E2F|nr:hypothetical protein [Calidithermus chliarophilus]